MTKKKQSFAEMRKEAMLRKQEEGLVQAKAPKIEQQIDDKTEFPPVFIGGAGRSGTTLLRVILDSHPNIACGPEIKLTPMIVNMCLQFQQLWDISLKAYYISPTDIKNIFASFFMSFVHNYLKTV